MNYDLDLFGTVVYYSMKSVTGRERNYTKCVSAETDYIPEIENIKCVSADTLLLFGVKIRERVLIE